MLHRLYTESPIGLLCLESDGSALTTVHVSSGRDQEENPDNLLFRTEKELCEYFNRSRHEFDIPVGLSGTDFQVRVWKSLMDIPYGTTCSYADIAAKTGNPKAVRAVGGAIHRNPVMIIVPCHRVIGKNGDLVGFGAGLDVKIKLLDVEK